MSKATVIIPTTAAESVVKSIKSVLNQSIPTECYVVIDGRDNVPKFYSQIVDQIKELENPDRLHVSILPINVGANGFYGHRVYSAFTHLVNTEYVLYLDQDCWFEENHVESVIKEIEATNSQWGYSLRKICDKEGTFICNDDCESLGLWRPVMQYNHIDTNCYCLKTADAIRISQAWHGGWGQDRVFFRAVSQFFTKYVCSGKYTVNYMLDGNDGSVKSEFFVNWNSVVEKQYNGKFPWRKDG